MDLSLYKDEAQLDKASPNKRKLSGDDNDDEDYEVSPRKKTKVKSETSAKRVKSPSKKSLVNDDSTESDEENLMEIKKKAKRQVKRYYDFQKSSSLKLMYIYRLRT